MNNKGQSLVTFIIILPILLIICGIVIEFSNIAYQKHHFTSVTKTIISSIIQTDKNIDIDKKNDIIKLYNDNNIQVDDITIIDNDGLTINASLRMDSLFGKIINKDYYEIKISLNGKFNDNNKIVFKKG